MLMPITWRNILSSTSGEKGVYSRPDTLRHSSLSLQNAITYYFVDTYWNNASMIILCDKLQWKSIVRNLSGGLRSIELLWIKQSMIISPFVWNITKTNDRYLTTHFYYKKGHKSRVLSGPAWGLVLFTTTATIKGFSDPNKLGRPRLYHWNER